MKNKVLIFSNNYDQSTADVTDWIEHLGFTWKRINGEGIINNITFILEKVNNNHENNFVSLWYRRTFPHEFYEYFKKMIPNNYFHELANNVFQEFETIHSYVYDLHFSQIKIKLSNNKIKINKLNVLNIASKCGLEIPNSLITTCKDELLKFFEQNNRIITKAASNSFSLNTNEGNITSYTNEVNFDFINTLPNSFYPSFFQEYIDKKYELRTFYIDRKCYSMAIFSQNNDKTKLDFREYDNELPNRCVPYQLPFFIEEKIINLMTELELNCGSIDLIRTNTGFVFLEVNEVGQFGMTSKPCNYYLEKEIAKFLTNINQ